MTLHTITYGHTAYTCPFSSAFRRHTTEEAAHLRESVASEGVEVPIRLYRDTELDLANCVLDGEGRLSAAVEVNAPPASVPFVSLGDMPTEEAYRRAKILNDVRRHDDAEAIRRRRAERVERVALARTLGASLRAIAEAEEVSESQIRADLKDAGAQGCAPELPERVTGRDGKSYVSTIPSGVSGDTPEPAPASHSSSRRSSPPPKRPGEEHEFYELLNAIVALASRVAHACNEVDADSKLRLYLMHLGFVHPRQKYVGEKHYGWRCVGLRDLYRAVRWAGLRGKQMTKDEMLKRIEVENAKEDQQ